MAGHGPPPMPLATSSKKAMKMATVSVTSQKPGEVASKSAMPTQDAVRAIPMNLRPAQSKDSEQADQPPITHASTSGQKTMNLQRNKVVNREKDLDMQRIQLAEKVRDKDKECKMLEDELASIKSSNEALEAECASLHGKIVELAQRLEAQAIETGQRDEATSATLRDLESRLEKATKSLEEDQIKAKKSDQAMREILGELNTAKQTVRKSERAHESRERELNQRLYAKGAEAKKLRKEISTLRATCADAVSKKASAHKELEKARDEHVAQCQALQERLDKLQHAIEPFPQLVVIGVDVSGSVHDILHKVKQAYRDVLHAVKSNNSDARIAVVIHGEDFLQKVSPVQTITDETFRVMDSVSIAAGSEDYEYCLRQAGEILKIDDSREKLIILIGDGQAIGIDEDFLVKTCEQFKSDLIMVHSIVLGMGSLVLFNGLEYWDSLFLDLARSTGGLIAFEETYLSVLDALLRLGRERHFNNA